MLTSIKARQFDFFAKITASHPVILPVSLDEVFKKLIRISRFDLLKDLLLATPIDAGYYNSLHHACIGDRDAACSDLFIAFYTVHPGAAQNFGELALYAEQKLLPSASLVKFLEYGVPCAFVVAGFEILDIRKPLKVAAYLKYLVGRNGTVLCTKAYETVMDKFWASRGSPTFAQLYGGIVEKMVGSNGVTDPLIMARFLPLLMFGLPKHESEPLILKLIKNASSFPSIYESVHLQCLDNQDWLCAEMLVNHYRSRVTDYPNVDQLFIQSSKANAAIQHLRIYTDVWSLSTSTKLDAFVFVDSADVERFDYFYSTLVDSSTFKVESQQALTDLLSKSKCKILSTPALTTESCRKTIELVQNNPILDHETLNIQLSKFVRAVDKLTLFFNNIQSRDIVLQGILLNSPHNESLYTSLHIGCIHDRKDNCKRHFMDFYEVRGISWKSQDSLIQPAVDAHAPAAQILEMMRLKGVTVETVSDAMTQLALTKRLITLGHVLGYPRVELVKIKMESVRRVLGNVLVGGDLELLTRLLKIPYMHVDEVKKALDDYKKVWLAQDARKVELLVEYVKKYEVVG